MKKSLLILICLMSMGMLYAQPWFDAGLKGGIGTSMMYNNQIFDNQEVVHKFKPGYTVGAKLGFNFIQEHQITFDVMKSQFSQAFTYRPEGWSASTDAVREFTIDGLDLLLMYRTNRNGTYFEIGPQWSTYSKVKYSDEGDDFISPTAPADLVNSSNFGVTAGFGGYIFGTDNFGVATGLRFNYMISDLASATGQDKNFPIFTNRDSNPTHNLSVMFVIEVNYDFGYLVSPKCGTRGKLFVF
ncbi:MAG: outer membrane beta-barrel protein [Lentimicrobium sp.]|nr:outer membrane beta-barrel protein [Lentimicrobium sp.]